MAQGKGHKDRRQTLGTAPETRAHRLSKTQTQEGTQPAQPDRGQVRSGEERIRPQQHTGQEKGHLRELDRCRLLCDEPDIVGKNSGPIRYFPRLVQRIVASNAVIRPWRRSCTGNFWTCRPWIPKCP